MNQFFRDVIMSPEMNWGTTNFQVKTATRVNNYGVMEETDVEIVDIDVECSTQLLRAEDLANAGMGQYAGRVVYDVFTLDDTLLTINVDPTKYRSIILNGQEFEITESPFEGINRGTDEQDGYFRIRIASVAKNQSGVN